MLELFGDVLAVVKQAYVVPVDDRKLIEASLSGMMTALDPHSSYLAPAGFGELRERTEGQYSGVGLTISAEGGFVKVISPMDGGPAARAGVQAGDVISAIDGSTAAGLSVSEVSDKLRGAASTEVRVTFLRDGADPLEVTLTREIIKIESVTGRIEGDFGYVRISTFNENTGRELNEVMARLQSENPGIKRLLGVEGNIGEGMGLPADFMVRVLKHVGNYGEVYERNVGANTPIGIPREGSLNAMWNNGGILYPMPFR
jgi:carboxyl-terminal processing protease